MLSARLEGNEPYHVVVDDQDPGCLSNYLKHEASQEPLPISFVLEQAEDIAGGFFAFQLQLCLDLHKFFLCPNMHGIGWTLVQLFQCCQTCGIM